MAKVTKKQFEKAMKDLPKLREAEAVVIRWNDGLKAIGGAVEHMDVLEIEWSLDGKVTHKGQPKEVPSAVAKTD